MSLLDTRITSTKNYRKNRLFAKYGHECEMANDLDELPIFIPGNTLWARFKRGLIRVRTVSETSRNGNKYLRSQGAIANEKHRHFKKYSNIIHPFSDTRKWWEFLMCIVFFVQFILIPLDVAFFPFPHHTIYKTKIWKCIRMALDIFCLVDCFLNFGTGYYNPQKKQVVLKPKKIAMHYFSTYFFVDFISSIPTHIDLFTYININGKFYMVLQITSILKILRLVTFFRYCSDYLQTFEISYALQRLILIIITSIIYFHLVACTLVFSHGFNMGYLSSNKPTQTIIEDSLIKGGSYTGAFYRATIVISNAGYGKVMPKSNVEFLLVVFIWVVSRILLIILVGRLMQVIKASTSASHKYIEMVRQLREYMSYRQLPEYMQRRLLTYYEFRFQKSYFRESEILSTISGQLRQEIVMHSCRKLVENVAFFKNLPLTLLVRIVSCLHSEVFLVNDVIVRATTPGNSMFFIASGTVAVFTSSGREICHLEDGAHFGEIALVMRDELRVASVVAVEVCELYRLDRKEFVRAIHPYPDLLDNIQRIAADRMERTTMLDEHNRREMASRRLY